MEAAGEMMGDTIDSALDGEDMEDEAGDLVGQVTGGAGSCAGLVEGGRGEAGVYKRGFVCVCAHIWIPGGTDGGGEGCLAAVHAATLPPPQPHIPCPPHNPCLPRPC